MESKLNILFLCGWYPSRVLTTNGDFVQRHAEAVNTIHNVTVLHIISDKNNTKNIEYSTEDINGVNTYINYIKSTKNPLLKAFRFIKSFFKTYKELKNVDIIHLHEVFPFGIFTLFNKKPIVITEHWTGYHKPQSKNISFIELFISKLIVKKAKFICPVSKDLGKSMQALNLKGTYKTVPNVVDTKKFKPSKNKSSKFRILHVSHMLDKHKNVSGIIKTIKDFSKHTQDFELILIGKNPERYNDLINNLNLSKYVKLINQIPHQQIIEHMQKADVFVLFSNYENLPCVILESFACGTPVISTKVGGISEFFPENYGFLINKGDRTELLNKLKEIYSSNNYNSKKLHNYAKVNFSKESIANQFNQIYKQCI